MQMTCHCERVKKTIQEKEKKSKFQAVERKISVTPTKRDEIVIKPPRQEVTKVRKHNSEFVYHIYYLI